LAIISKEKKMTIAQSEYLQKQANELIEMDILDEAIEIYIKLSCLFPENENILIGLALTFMKNMDYSIAEGVLLTVITISESPLAYHYLGVITNFLGRKDESQKYFEKSLELKPSLADISTNGKYGLYKKNYGEIPLKKCPFCGSDDFNLINVLNQSQNSLNFNQINPIRKWEDCNNCSLIFANPVPSKQSLLDYNFELFNYVSQIKNNNIEKIVFENNVANERIKNIERFIPKPYILDINSVDVKFISVAQRRLWQVKGLDENPTRAFENQNNFDLGIENVSFSDFETDEKFGAITLWEEIEKISDFKGFLTKVYNLLEPNGVFAFSFHDLNSYISKKLNYDYPIWSYPNYLYFFNTSTMERIINQAGFVLVGIDCVERKYLANTDFYCVKSQTQEKFTV